MAKRGNPILRSLETSSASPTMRTSSQGLSTVSHRHAALIESAAGYGLACRPFPFLLACLLVCLLPVLPLRQLMIDKNLPSPLFTEKIITIEEAVQLFNM